MNQVNENSEETLVDGLKGILDTMFNVEKNKKGAIKGYASYFFNHITEPEKRLLIRSLKDDGDLEQNSQNSLLLLDKFYGKYHKEGMIDCMLTLICCYYNLDMRIVMSNGGGVRTVKALDYYTGKMFSINYSAARRYIYNLLGADNVGEVDADCDKDMGYDPLWRLRFDKWAPNEMTENSNDIEKIDCLFDRMKRPYNDDIQEKIHNMTVSSNFERLANAIKIFIFLPGNYTYAMEALNKLKLEENDDKNITPFFTELFHHKFFSLNDGSETSPIDFMRFFNVVVSSYQKNDQSLAEFLTKKSYLAGDEKYHSIMDWLFHNPERLKFIANDSGLLNKVVAVAAKNPKQFAAALFARRTAAAGRFENISVLYHLLGTAKGCQLLANSSGLLNNVVAAAETNSEQFAAAFFARRTVAAGQFENTSVLYSLLSAAEGRQLLANSSGLLDSVVAAAETNSEHFAAALFARRTAAAGRFKNTSGLTYFLATAEGRKLLLANSSGLLNSVVAAAEKNSEHFAAALFDRIPAAAGRFKNTSVLYSLLSAAEGRQLLANSSGLLDSVVAAAETNPEQFAAALFARRTAAAGHLEDISVLYYLLGTAVGRHLLANSSGLLNSVIAAAKKKPEHFAAALFERCTDVAGQNISVLHYFLSTAEGCELLANSSGLLDSVVATAEKNPEQFADALFDRLPAAAGQNVSVLHYFLSTAEGCELLANSSGLLNSVVATAEKNPEVFAAALFDRLPAAAGRFENTSVLYNLLSTAEGHKLLANSSGLLDSVVAAAEKNPEQFAAALYAKRTADAGEFAHTSAFSLLLKANGGQELAEKIGISTLENKRAIDKVQDAPGGNAQKKQKTAKNTAKNIGKFSMIGQSTNDNDSDKDVNRTEQNRTEQNGRVCNKPR